MDELRELKKRAARAGISMNAICNHAGVARSTPWRWERGSSEARTSKLRLLSESLAALIADKKVAAKPRVKKAA